MVDVAGGTLAAHRRIVIRGDPITVMEPMSAPAPGDATQTLDGTGLYLMPGLVDHHVHLRSNMDSALVRVVRGGVMMVQAMEGRSSRSAGRIARLAVEAVVGMDVMDLGDSPEHAPGGGTG